ncbi:MAG: NADH-quinone oxidoreductase subunit NuoG [Thermodesulfobacteriota bacterium]|jgi:NADH-quinone oxidoreductase subunit G
MPKLKIDGLEIEVERGTKVIEAAARLGIIIPRFCFHPGLGPVGACRVCAVKFEEGPVKGVQMSCMTDAQDGMVVSTTDEEAADFRKHVIEWLMMNHPHDCPVCDEGGHCLLQDLTVAGGHGIRRYLGKKRTYNDQYLGVFVQHEMNRCIQCWRCRRFYQEFAGYRDLGALQIAHHTYFGRATDGQLESPFSGNIIDICPTGVYTDKPSRFTGRRWDFERGPSLCIHCSLGCHIITSARYREMTRLEARFSESVNGYFICDRGRYGFYYTNHPERPRRARIRTEEVSLDQAIQTAAQKIIQINQKNGPKAIACLGSARSCVENQAMLIRFCRVQGWNEPTYFETPTMAKKVKRAVARLDEQLAVSMREIEKADFILAVGADPVNEAPMLALAMRQAFRNEATIVVIDPRPVFLPFEFEHLPVAPDDLEPCLTALIKGAVHRSAAEKMGEEALRFYDTAPAEYPDAPIKNRMVKITQKLRQSRYPVIICGTSIVRETTPDVAADSALLLRAARGRAGLFYLMSEANTFGAALLSSEEGSVMDVVESIEKGSVKGLMLVESDPFRSFPDYERLKQAVDKLDLFLVMDYLPSFAARLAHLFFPTQTLFEMETSFVNQEGRVQFATSAYRGGIPISQISAGGHPLRVFRRDIPGGESQPAWQILAKLANIISLPGREMFSLSKNELWSWIAKEYPIFANVPIADELPDDVRVHLAQGREKLFPSGGQIRSGGLSRENSTLELVMGDWTFGTEELSTYSKYLQQVEKEPCLFMSPKDASMLGLKDRERITLPLDKGRLEMELRIVDTMAPGVIVMPKHRQLAWQKIEKWPVKVAMGQIRK